MAHQLIQNYEKLSYIKWDNQKDLNRLLGPLLKSGLAITENLLEPSAKKF